jgi:ferric-dicitrate binding protein FerR (iron transport regulator)
MKDQSDQIMLTPGITGIFNRNDQTFVTQTGEDSNSMAWKNKQLVFKKTPMRKVIRALRSYFQKDIDVTNEKILDCRFTGSFNDPTLEEVVETLSLALGLEMTLNQNVYMLDGSGCEEI